MSNIHDQKTKFSTPFLSNRQSFSGFIAIAFVFTLMLSACGESEFLSRYEVTLVIESDCSQTGISMDQCVDTEVLSQSNRKGSWVLEKREDGHLFQPQSSFNLTLENGRVLSGIYFADSSSTVENSEVCIGEAEHCFYARSKSTESDASLGCQKIIDKSIIFTINKEILKGQIIESQITDARCGVQQSSQRITQIDGVIADEVVFAREDS